jgi:hypothetical protein
MGYYDRSTLKPHSSVAFIEKENEYYHPWSIDAIGHQYGWGKLKDIIPLNDYLNLPAFLVESLVKGITKGDEQRAKADAAAAPPTDGLSKEDRELLALAKKLNISKP